MSKPKQEYLGDGLYADYDDFQVALRANHHENDIEAVYLEPSVCKSFIRYLKKYQVLDPSVIDELLRE